MNKREIINLMLEESGAEPELEPAALFMTPKQIQLRAKDLAAKNPSPRVKAMYDRVLKDAYRDQQELLKKAAKLSK